MALGPLWIPGEKERKAFLLDLSTIFIRNGNYGVKCSLFKQLKILIDRWYYIRVYQNLGLQSAWECILQGLAMYDHHIFLMFYTS